MSFWWRGSTKNKNRVSWETEYSEIEKSTLKAIESYKRQNCSCRGWCCINHVKYGWRISESDAIWSKLEQISSSVWFSFLWKWQHPDRNDRSPYLFHVCYFYWKCFNRNERIILYLVIIIIYSYLLINHSQTFIYWHLR